MHELAADVRRREGGEDAPALIEAARGLHEAEVRDLAEVEAVDAARRPPFGQGLGQGEVPVDEVLGSRGGGTVRVGGVRRRRGRAMTRLRGNTGRGPRGGAANESGHGWPLRRNDEKVDGSLFDHRCEASVTPLGRAERRYEERFRRLSTDWQRGTEAAHSTVEGRIRSLVVRRAIGSGLTVRAGRCQAVLPRGWSDAVSPISRRATRRAT